MPLYDDMSYQYVINSVTLFPAKLQHLLPVGLLVVLPLQVIQLQHLFCEKRLEQKHRGSNHVRILINDLTMTKCLLLAVESSLHQHVQLTWTVWMSSVHLTPWKWDDLTRWGFFHWGCSALWSLANTSLMTSHDKSNTAWKTDAIHCKTADLVSE